LPGRRFWASAILGGTGFFGIDAAPMRVVIDGTGQVAYVGYFT
jgi:hypothetical protein